MILNCNSDKGRAGLLLGMTWFGTSRGKVYDRVLSHPVDYLFCSDGIDYWVIPVEEIRKAGNNNTIHLRKEPNKNNQGFETWKYLV